MASTWSDVVLRGRRRSVRWKARYSELIPVIATATAWAVLLWTARTGTAHGGHVHPATPGAVVGAMTMAVAMMGLMSLPAARTVAFMSPWWRAPAAVVVLFASFTFVWTMIVLAAQVLSATVTWFTTPLTCGVLLFAGALAQIHPHRDRIALRCDVPMRIRTRGHVAGIDCARFGALTALRCVRLCGLPMLAVLALPAGLGVMAAVTALTLLDRLGAQRWQVAVAAGYTALSAAVLAEVVAQP